MRTLHVFPADDPEFDAYVRQCLDGLRPSERDKPDALCGAIRLKYPRAAVHSQTQLASVNRTWVWYVYRDGAAIPTGD